MPEGLMYKEDSVDGAVEEVYIRTEQSEAAPARSSQRSGIWYMIHMYSSMLYSSRMRIFIQQQYSP